MRTRRRGRQIPRHKGHIFASKSERGRQDHRLHARWAREVTISGPPLQDHGVSLERGLVCTALPPKGPRSIAEQSACNSSRVFRKRSFFSFKAAPHRKNTLSRCGPGLHFESLKGLWREVVRAAVKSENAGNTSDGKRGNPSTTRASRASKMSGQSLVGRPVAE